MLALPPLISDVPAELEHAVSIAKVAVYLITGLVVVIGTLGGYLWQRLNNEVKDNESKNNDRVKELYQHIENIRNSRDIQVAALNTRLSTLEGEHRGCSERLNRLEAHP